MYKLFLCLRYLRSRVIAYFAVAGVALCVAMMVIVVSVMNGFLDKVERAARGLFGEVMIGSTGLGGIARYEEFIAELKQKVPEVRAATPFIVTKGLIRVPGNDYRQHVDIVGIRLAPREGRPPGETMDYYSDVSSFASGLFAQAGRAAPTFETDKNQMRRAVEDDERLMRQTSMNSERTRRVIADALKFHRDAVEIIENDEFVADKLKELTVLSGKADASSGDPGEVRRLSEELDRIIYAMTGRFRDLYEVYAAEGVGGAPADLETLRTRIDQAVSRLQWKELHGPDRRVVLGLGIPGMVFRTPEGETIRKIVPGCAIGLSLVPLGRKQVSATSVELLSEWYTVVDDCRTDISTIDSSIVYAPFRTLQKYNAMDMPDRCSMVLVRLREGLEDHKALAKVHSRIQDRFAAFVDRRPDVLERGADPVVMTWRERHADAVGMLEDQRTLVIVIIGVISLVSVVLIFVIFYMIVVQKTRDIGVLKAIGASDAGIAGIFLSYGATIGLVGSVLGTIGGYYFVRYINPIRDWVEKSFGFRGWRKEWFLFEKIPNDVSPATVAAIVAGAILAGLIGALIPAIRAARMQPVEALRYE